MLFRLPFKKTFSEPERDELSISLFILSNNFCLRFLIVSFEAPFIIAAWVLPRWLIVNSQYLHAHLLSSLSYLLRFFPPAIKISTLRRTSGFTFKFLQLLQRTINIPSISF
ncbi:tail fiber protein [Escherichia phage JN01]|uniref:Tail fiber protein n=1 Tax=Escherichia phage JN01 TaxID=2692737 RepID=A0A6B9SP11_9CAUD|nr:tail fiber protein [Escherichia phage JN01]